MKWYVLALQKYGNFSGRSRRQEYWMYTLFNFLFFVVAIILDNLLNLTIAGLPYGLFYILLALATFVPGLAVSVRRLHDIGKSGWMILIALIPLAGAIWLLVLMTTDSQEGKNEYGPYPKEVDPNSLSIQAPNQSLEKERVNNNILLGVVIWILGTNILWPLTLALLARFYNNSELYIPNLIFGIIGSAIPLVLSFAATEKKIKSILLILGIINIVIVLAMQITRMVALLKMHY
jgi:uncharacterized membrane protein YhaH (DUF805 family)